MKLVPTSIARRPGNGGYASALEFKRAILAESEGVLKKVATLDPAKRDALPVQAKLAIKMHQDRVVKYTRKIAEIEAGGNGEEQSLPSEHRASVDAPAGPEAPPPPAAVPGGSNIETDRSHTDVTPASGGGQKGDLSPDSQPAGIETGAVALPSDTVAETGAPSKREPHDPAGTPEESGGRRVASDNRNATLGYAMDKFEEARELLGIWQAMDIIPSWCPEGWTRRPELAEAKPFARNQRWRYGAEKGDVVDLVRIVFGDADVCETADRIIEMVRDMPSDLQAFCHPAIVAPKQGKGDAILPEIEDAADFLAKDLPNPPELVEGLLHQGSKMILAGGSKSFKTWSLLDLALSVAYGRDWLGFATQQGAALYINLEIGGAFFGRRIRTVAEAKSIVIEQGRLSIMNLRGHAADLSKLLPGLLASISERRYALIVVDPIYKVLGGRDENDAGHIAGLLNDLERLAVETGAAVVFAAHFSKGSQAGKASIDRMSGSGVFARDPDTILALTQHEEEGAFTVEATLRNHPPIEPFVVRWEHPLLRREDGLNPAKLKQVSGRPKAHTADDLLKVLGDEELSFSAWKAAALKAGISETTFKALRKELVTGGQVCHSEETSAYRRTVKGEKVL